MSERDAQGHFLPGNQIGRGHGRGRRSRDIELDELKILSENVSADDWAEIVKIAKSYALAGDSKARDWLWERMFGKVPVEGLLGIEAAQQVVQQIIFKRPADAEGANNNAE